VDEPLQITLAIIFFLNREEEVKVRMEIRGQRSNPQFVNEGRTREAK
jgi:hypothetical protein